VANVALLAGVGTASRAQTAIEPDSLAQAKKRLAGEVSRDWVFQQVRTIMGAADRCTQGEVFRFQTDGTLTAERCVEGRLARETRRWALERESPYDLRLTIDGEPSTVLFKTETGAQLMILRKRSDSKTAPTVDREFRLSQD
jgi:hypothetical protein